MFKMFNNKPKCIEYPIGTKHWFINGKLHREDGPAIEYSNGSKQWFINGKQIFHKFIVIDLINNETLFETFSESEALEFERERFANKQCVWIERESLK